MNIARNILMIFAAVAFIAAAGCGSGGSESEPPQPAEGQNAESADADGDSAMTEEPAGDSAQTSASDQDASAEANYTDQTAEGAVHLWINRLIEGDFRGAASVCKQDSAGAAALREQADGFDRAREDESAGPGMVQTAVSFMTQGFEEASIAQIESGQDRSVFEVVVPGNDPQQVEVVRVESAWRVVPPESGLPSG